MVWKVAAVTAFFLLMIGATYIAGCSGIGHTVPRDTCLTAFSLCSIAVTLLLGAKSSKRQFMYLCFLPLVTYSVCALILDNTGGLGYRTDCEANRIARKTSWLL